MPIFAYILTALAAYLIGSIPTGFLVGKARGIDIRTVGSGNIGATNVLRYFGKPAGVFVLLVDALKGWLAVVVLAKLVSVSLYPGATQQAQDWLKVTAAFCAILGHNYTCWLDFKGGKGIATSAGVLLALVPAALAIILVIWVIVLAFTRYVSLASIAASFALPFAVWFTQKSSTMVLVTAAMTTLAIYKHKANIKRLLNGTENRLNWTKASRPAGSSRQMP